MTVYRGWLFAAYALVVLIWGTTWMAIKISIADIPPFLSAAIRFFIASGLLLLIVWIKGRRIRFNRESLKLYFVIGLGNFFFGYGLTYWGTLYIYSSVTAILWVTMPLIVSLFAHFMLPDEHLNYSRFIGILISITGTIFIVQGQWQALDVNAIKGIILVLLSVAGSAASNVYYKKHVESEGALVMNMTGMFIGAIGLLAGSAISEDWQAVHLTRSAILAVMYLAVFGSAIAFTMYFWLFKHFSVVTLSYSTFFVPLLATFFGWFLLGEALTLKTIFGGLLILSGVGLADLNQRRKKVKEVEVANPGI